MRKKKKAKKSRESKGSKRRSRREVRGLSHESGVFVCMGVSGDLVSVLD